MHGLSLLCLRQGPGRSSCILASGMVTFGWINENILNPQIPINLSSGEAVLSPCSREKFHNGWKLCKNLTWVRRLARQCFFFLRSATTSSIASGISVYWENTFPTLGGNSLYNQNNYRTRIISAGKNWKNMCGSVFRECSLRVVVRGKKINLHSGELVDIEALSCDLGLCLLERKSRVILSTAEIGSWRLTRRISYYKWGWNARPTLAE